MLNISDKQKFDAIISRAIETVAINSQDDKRAQHWINAIGKAVELAAAGVYHLARRRKSGFSMESGIKSDLHGEW